jgi:hypothetical protein
VNVCLTTCFLFSACIVLAACGNRVLRGSVSPSSDGKTYLAVVDDNGGHCGPLLFDGKAWPYKIGEQGIVVPGRHRIQCGGWIEFDIPQGVVFKFDYWGT